MELAFVKTSPAGNETVLVETPVPRAAQPAVAEKLLAMDSVGGEQVGYLEPPSLPGAEKRLQMMGGEFCGNASMSAAAYLARKRGLAAGETLRVALEVSGASGLVPCTVENRAGEFIGQVEMPLPLRVDAEGAPFPRVDLPGITHLIAPAAYSPADAEREIRALARKLGVPALGIVLYDEAGASIRPLVYVPATDTAVWEHGCGSGTAAVGCLETMKARSSRAFTLRQPGGEISVRTRYEAGTIIGLTISTPIRFMNSGTISLQ